MRKLLLLATVSMVSVGGAQIVHAQDKGADAAKTPPSDPEIIVTGSRVVVNGNQMPTPVTVVNQDELRQTTPTTIADALNKLPAMTASRSAQTQNNPTTNAVGNFLNLRGFGIQRTLILLDGHRVPSSAQDGSVDTNTIPQLFVSRVDLVTGGVSAVYGSDAVTGVVNYVLDHKFKGLKGEFSGGISNYGDAPSYRAAIGFGSQITQQLHVEASYEHFQQEGIFNAMSRPTAAAVYCQIGTGSAANPYRLASGCRFPYNAFNGLIVSGPAAFQQFTGVGTLGAFQHGASTISPITEIGGSGTYVAGGSLSATVKLDQAFARADYDFDGGPHLYLQGSLTKSYNYYNFPEYTTTTAPLIFSSSNGFLPAATQAAVGANGTPVFAMQTNDPGWPTQGVVANTNNLLISAGVNGKIGKGFEWSLGYSFGRTTLHEVSKNNINQQLFAAATDAVSSGGSVKCYAATQAATASAYANCVPVNLFGPNSSAPGTFDYFSQDTYFDLKNDQHLVDLSIVGSPIELPAGPVRTAISGQFRSFSLELNSPFSPLALANCTGLRFNCTQGSTTLWLQNVVSSVPHVSEQVEEIAGEVQIPLLKDRAFIRDLSTNGAIRYAHYSVSGGATTWKLGLDWAPVSGIRFRGTRSKDFRAPTLNDLFAPVSVNNVGFTDALTNTSGFAPQQSQGNPNLKPETSYTWTAGVVFTPAFLPNFSASVDWYDIQVRDAIEAVAGNVAIYNQLCIQSNGTSPYCALYSRPFGLGNTSAANYPTKLYSLPLNVGRLRTSGVDLDLGYSHSLGAGRLSLRGLMSYQPTLDVDVGVGQGYLNGAGAATGAGLFAPKLKFTVLANFKTGPFTVGGQVRWRSALNASALAATATANNYAYNVAPVAYTDANIGYDFTHGSGVITAFISVQNVFNVNPPVYTIGSAAFANFIPPVFQGDSIMGRYFTGGVRFKF
ncbi:TonB-dependent receptor domain-containing protein [Novosphingobium terrae]|uniref:TonB-dependent receptor domain-containing protein n=1 Tax=Novosphingobium terrae TaxID=2726189 RepID=UPI0019820E26|nr:TonB-dependent receptor [Novosphingobium terrae]